jgi:hypothetical protein
VPELVTVGIAVVLVDLPENDFAPREQRLGILEVESDGTAGVSILLMLASPLS